LGDISKEGQFFIKAISDHLNNRRTEPVAGLDWDKVLAYAEFHKVEGMLYLQCRGLLPKNKLALFGMKGMLQFKDSLKKAAAVEQIERAFTERAINFSVVKGVEIAQLYPAVKERAMGDIDLVVKSEDRERAGEALVEIGAKLKERVCEGVFEWIYDLEGVAIELHDHLQYETSTAGESFRYTERIWDIVLTKENSSRLALDWNFHLVFLIMHLEKHFVGEGVGLRLFIDLAALCQKVEINQKQLEADLEQVGLLKFASLCFAFCEKWFDVAMPFCAKLDETFYKNFTEKVLENGLYGECETGRQNRILTSVSSRGRLGAALNRYFPPLATMKSEMNLGYLEKWPILLPIAWVHRYILAISSGKLCAELGRLRCFLDADAKVDERSQMLSAWGISEYNREKQR